jgi:hypothetical protein
MHFLDEMAQHLLRYVEICDHTILQGPDRLDRARSAAQHPLRLEAHRVHLPATDVDRDHRGLREDDPPAAHVDERVGGAEVHSHVAAAKSG